MSNRLKDCIVTEKIGPIYNSEKFRFLFGIPRALYKLLKKELVNEPQKEWKTIMIDGKRLGMQMNVKVMKCLNKRSSRNSAVTNDDAEYMAEHTEKEKHAKNIVKTP